MLKITSLYPQALITKGVIFASATSTLELHPEEAKIGQSFASQKRVEEFSKGRSAAKEALKSLGVENFPLLRTTDGNPIWPDNITGSITHSNGIAIAAVALKNKVQAIGIDLEFKGRERDPKLFERIATKNERSWIISEPELSATRGLQIFSAKEAIYKAFFQLLKIKLTFQDAELSWQGSYFKCKININEKIDCEVFQNQDSEFIFSAIAL